VCSSISQEYVNALIPLSQTSKGSSPYFISQDSGHTQWMCNRAFPGTWYAPADWIIEVHAPGSYLHAPELRISGTTADAQKYISDFTTARVYADDDIQACIEFWRGYFWTFASGPKTNEILLWY
jgi:hypothetical protein